jgi:hypothetical protein
LRAAGSLALVGAGSVAAVVLVNRFAPAFADIARGAAAIVLIVVAVALYRGFRPRGVDDRRQDERREEERRENT